MTEPRLLVAGIGNVFLGDDGFGVEVAQHLQRDGGLGDGIILGDYGIRGLDLAYAILAGYDAVILIDALPRGEPPGTLCVLEADVTEDVETTTEGPRRGFQGHSMTPDAVLQLVRTMGGRPPRVLVVGCEPESFGADGVGRMGLSDTVRAAIQPAVIALRHLVEELREVAAPMRTAADG